MYAFSVALAANKMTTELKPPGQTDLIAQVRGGATVCTGFSMGAIKAGVTARWRGLQVAGKAMPAGMGAGCWILLHKRACNLLHAALLI